MRVSIGSEALLVIVDALDPRQEPDVWEPEMGDSRGVSRQVSSAQLAGLCGKLPLNNSSTSKVSVKKY